MAQQFRTKDDRNYELQDGDTLAVFERDGLTRLRLLPARANGTRDLLVGGFDNVLLPVRTLPISALDGLIFALTGLHVQRRSEHEGETYYTFVTELLRPGHRG